MNYSTDKTVKYWIKCLLSFFNVIMSGMMGNTDNRRFLSICGNRLQMSLSGRIKEIIFSLVDGQTSKVTHSDISLIFTCCPGLFVPKKCSLIRQKWTICAVLFWKCVCVCVQAALSAGSVMMIRPCLGKKSHSKSTNCPSTTSVW